MERRKDPSSPTQTKTHKAAGIACSPVVLEELVRVSTYERIHDACFVVAGVGEETKYLKKILNDK